jgi:ATP-dependent DNA helicase PIF1
MKDWQLLSTRVRAKVAMTNQDLSAFTNAIHIYQKREEVHEYNHARLRELNNPVLALRASHRGHGAEKASTEEAGNLHRRVHVSIDSRVMLLENVWADHALLMAPQAHSGISFGRQELTRQKTLRWLYSSRLMDMTVPSSSSIPTRVKNW